MGRCMEMSVGDQVMGSTMWDLLPEDSIDDGTDDEQGDALVTSSPAEHILVKTFVFKIGVC